MYLRALAGQVCEHHIFAGLLQTREKCLYLLLESAEKRKQKLKEHCICSFTKPVQSHELIMLCEASGPPSWTAG